MFSTNNKNSVRCLERGFSGFKALGDFCKQLKNGDIEGLCDCVCNRFIEWMNDKIKPCTMEHSTQDQIRQSFIYDPANVQYRFKIEEGTTLNVYAPCHLRFWRHYLG